MRSVVDLIHREDIDACQAVQRGVRAGLTAPGALSHLERCIAQLARWWRERMDVAP